MGKEILGYNKGCAELPRHGNCAILHSHTPSPPPRVPTRHIFLLSRLPSPACLTLSAHRMMTFSIFLPFVIASGFIVYSWNTVLSKRGRLDFVLAKVFESQCILVQLLTL